MFSWIMNVGIVKTEFSVSFCDDDHESTGLEKQEMS
jgi:hypothetical protein